MNRFLTYTAVGLFLGLTPAVAQNDDPVNDPQAPPAIQEPAEPALPSEAVPLDPQVPGAPIPGAVVVIEELRRETTSAGDGTFQFAGVPAGHYHLMVKADGYSSRRSEIDVAASAAPLTSNAGLSRFGS